MKHYDTKYLVPALQKAVSIVQTIANYSDQIKMKDLLATAGCSKSHLFGILQTLSYCGWIQQNDDKTFTIGEELVKLGTMRLYPLELVRLFYSELAPGNESLHFTFQMSILEQTDIIYLAKTQREEGGRIITFPGMRMPAHCTAMGKVLLSSYSREALEALYPVSDLEKITPNTTATVDDLWMQIMECKRSGYCLEVGETKTGYSCVAAPVYSSFGRITAAISMATLIPYPSKAHEEAIQIVQETCKRISGRLGYECPPSISMGGRDNPDV